MNLRISKKSFTRRVGLTTRRPPVASCPQHAGEQGFSLIETTIAMVLMLIVALGSASLFTFSIYNNSGGSDRAVSLAIAQQAMEALRGAKFNETTTDAPLNAGTVVQNGVIRDGRSFNVTRTVVDNSTTLKSITVTVTSAGIVTGWASGAGGTITLISQRSKAD
jgi:prepilin-type N-terminal cleavage/methylation domain-containing protein